MTLMQTLVICLVCIIAAGTVIFMFGWPIFWVVVAVMWLAVAAWVWLKSGIEPDRQKRAVQALLWPVMVIMGAFNKA